HDCIMAAKRGFVELPRSGGASNIEADDLLLQSRRNNGAGILPERGKVIGARADDGVLKIDQAEIVGEGAALAPDDVRGMEIAQRQRLPCVRQSADQDGPDMVELRAGIATQLLSADVGNVPIGEQAGLDHQRGSVIARNFVPAAGAVLVYYL